MEPFSNPLTRLLGIRLPIIQAGMIWASGYKLAAAVSNAGGLGIIGAGSMYPAILDEHITKCKIATSNPFAVNLPLLYPDIDQHIATIIKHHVPIVFTSAGNPKTYTAELKKHGIKVVHVVSSSLFAQKAAAAGCDAVVAEGFEAGGHNGREETTTMVLINQVVNAVNIPVIAAGGIANGRQMLAAMVMGAQAVQMGTRFLASDEASSHQDFKQLVVAAKEGDTRLMLKKLTPVRLFKNKFFEDVENLEAGCADAVTLAALLGKGRAKKGMFEGDLAEGELEIGQVAAAVNEILPAAKIITQVWEEFQVALKNPIIL